jgi:hypothetical protein
MKKSIIAVTLAMVAVLNINPAHANLITNGDFETGDLTGWTTNTQEISVHPTMWAYDGSYAVDISPHNSLGSLTQFIQTDVGKSYELSYYLRSSGGTNQFDTIIGGNTVMSLKNFGQDYTLYSFFFTASSAMTELTFSSEQEFGAFVDNFEVVPAPEPASFLLFGVGLFGAGFMRRKAKS